MVRFVSTKQDEPVTVNACSHQRGDKYEVSSIYYGLIVLFFVCFFAICVSLLTLKTREFCHTCVQASFGFVINKHRAYIYIFKKSDFILKASDYIKESEF